MEPLHPHSVVVGRRHHRTIAQLAQVHMMAPELVVQALTQSGWIHKLRVVRWLPDYTAELGLDINSWDKVDDILRAFIKTKGSGVALNHVGIARAKGATKRAGARRQSKGKQTPRPTKEQQRWAGFYAMHAPDEG